MVSGITGFTNFESHSICSPSKYIIHTCKPRTLVSLHVIIFDIQLFKLHSSCGELTHIYPRWKKLQYSFTFHIQSCIYLSNFCSIISLLKPIVWISIMREGSTAIRDRQLVYNIKLVLDGLFGGKGTCKRGLDFLECCEHSLESFDLLWSCWDAFIISYV